jgi:tetratricopeptide (TPR) repeat protein
VSFLGGVGPGFGLRAAVLVLVTTAAGSALGQPDGEAAKAHYERATAAYALGNFTDAASSYEKAFELKPDPALLYNAAQAHRRAGNRQRAMELYRSFLQVFPRADNRDVAERHLRELERAPSVEAQRAPVVVLPARAALAAPAPTGRPIADPRRALWRRPWVWVAVGVSAVVAGTVTAMALSGKADPRPSWGTVGP